MRIRLKENTTLKFGRFKKGKLISLPTGDYVYVGSALSQKGSTSLARRLIRHATRSNHKSPHPIREIMINRFSECGLGPRDLLPKHGKTLHWNIDFLLDLQSAELVNIFAIRSTENRIAKRLEQNPHRDYRTKCDRVPHMLRVPEDKTSLGIHLTQTMLNS